MADAIRFSTLTEDQINEIQLFARTELRDTLKQQLIETKEELSIFYGSYYSACPEKFSFLGYKTTILQMVAHVKDKMNAENASGNYFTPEVMSTKKGKPNSTGTIRTAIGTFYVDRKIIQNVVTKTKPDTSIDAVKNALYCNAKKLFDKYEEEAAKFGARKLSIDKVHIDCKESGDIKGRVECTFCRKQSKVSCRVSDSQTYSWVLSNITSHIKNCKVLKNMLNPNADEINTQFGYDTNENFEVDEFQTETLELEINPVNKEEFELIHNNSLEITEDVLENTLFTQISVQSIKMKNTVSKYSEKKDKCVVNTGKIKLKKIYICQIDGDGDCAFSVMAHQLYHSKIRSDQHVRQTEILRRDAVEYIRAHLSEFQHDIKGRILETIPETLSTANFDDQCDKFLKNLAKQGFYGGKESIRAIAIMEKVNIVVFNENGPCYLVNRLNVEYDRTIFMAFRGKGRNENRCHYDSVVGISNEMMTAATEHLVQMEMQYIKNKNDLNVISIGA